MEEHNGERKDDFAPILYCPLAAVVTMKEIKVMKFGICKIATSTPATS